MDPVRNPFSPGAGTRPPELAGRGEVLEQGRILFERVKRGRPERSLLLTGLRGVGKTVLLNELQRSADSLGYQTLAVESHEGKGLGALLTPPLRSLLYDLDRLAGAGAKVRRALAVLRGFVGALRLKAGEVEIGLDVEPEVGTADSGDLELDLPGLLVAVGEAAQERSTAVGLFLDEVQYFSAKELGALIMAMHRVQQRQLPVVLVGAGLPILPALAGESKSYAERLFAFPDIGALSADDAATALREPAGAAGVEFEAPALAEVFRLTRGYPYFIQEWGYQSWNAAPGPPITRPVVQAATRSAVARLDLNFFRVRFDRLTPNERKILRAMAELGSGPYRIADLARLLRRKVVSLSPVRAQLIRKGMVYGPAHGEVAFTVPLFDEFMRRAVPEFSAESGPGA